MTEDPALVIMALAAATALFDWWAVATGRRRFEYVAKPAVMVLLMVAALLIDPGEATATRAFFLAALALSLAGDVFLMLERERFVAGLASFLLAHVAYITGLMLAPSFHGNRLALGYAVVIIPAFVVGPRIGRAVRESEPGLLGPVLAYIAVISTMVAFAIATRNPLAIAGAGLFYLSDAVLAWNRFVTPVRGGPLAVIITYHLGQGLLVLSLGTM
jgi:uncharacterized membrane protein YhhN